MVCPKCGHICNDLDLDCPSCGKPLSVLSKAYSKEFEKTYSSESNGFFANLFGSAGKVLTVIAKILFFAGIISSVIVGIASIEDGGIIIIIAGPFASYLVSIPTYADTFSAKLMK